MAKGFNLTAEINLRGPSNIRQVVGNIRKQLTGLTANVNVKLNPQTAKQITAVNKSFQTFNKTLQQTNSVSKSTAAALNQLSSAASGLSGNLKSIPQNLQKTVQATQQITQSNAKAAKATTELTTEFAEFGRQSALAVRRFAAFATVTGVIYRVSNAISSASKDFVDFQKELIKVAQVTNTSLGGLDFLVDRISQLSTGLGVSSQELIGVSRTLSQAGLSATETSKALQALARSALAPTFDNLNNTVEGSIALMKQFSISANQLEGALGSINAVAGKFAVEAGDIITAISRTGGVFANASKGVSQGTDALNEFIAVFTSVRATTRESAETIATGLRTIFTRIQREDTIDALKAYGVALTDLQGKFVGPYEATRRLAEGLSQLDPRDIRFSRIVEELGGFRQIGKVIPLIQQFSTAQAALNVAQRGSGSLARDAATAQLSLANQIAKVQEQFSALVRDIGQSQGFRDLAKLALDLTSGMVALADAAKSALPALTAIFAIKGFSALTQFGGGFLKGIKRGSGTGLNDGGYVHHFARGGTVPGVGNRDTVPAMLQPGEFVIRKKAVETIGTKNLHRMNKYADGGGVQKGKQFGGVGIFDSDMIGAGSKDVLSALMSSGKPYDVISGPAGSGKTTFAKQRFGSNFILSAADVAKYSQAVVLSGAGATKTGGFSPQAQQIMSGARKIIALQIPEQQVMQQRQSRLDQAIAGNAPDKRSTKQLEGTLKAPTSIGADLYKQFKNVDFVQRFNIGGQAKAGMIITEVLDKKQGAVDVTSRNVAESTPQVPPLASGSISSLYGLKGKIKAGAVDPNQPNLLPPADLDRVIGETIFGGKKSKSYQTEVAGVGARQNKVFNQAIQKYTKEAITKSAKAWARSANIKVNNVAFADDFQLPGGQVGSMFEQMIQGLQGEPIASAASEDKRPFDFIKGIGRLAKKGDTGLFNIGTDINYIDAKKSLANAGAPEFLKKISSQLTLDNVNSIKSAISQEYKRLVQQQNLSPASQNILSNIEPDKAYTLDDLLRKGVIKNKNVAEATAQGFEPYRTRGKYILKRNLGGEIKRFAVGGSAEDTVPALLTPGEFVINKKAASRIGSQRLHKLNKADKIQGYNKGGAVGRVQRFANGGDVFDFADNIATVSATAEKAMDDFLAALVDKIVQAKPDISFDDAYREAQATAGGTVAFGTMQAAQTGDQNAAKAVYDAQRKQVVAITKQIRSNNKNVTIAEARAAAERQVAQNWGGLVQKVKQGQKVQQQVNQAGQKLVQAQNQNAQAQKQGAAAGGGGKFNFSGLGTALAFLGPTLADQIGGVIGGTTGAGISGAAGAISAGVGIGAQFGPIGAFVGAVGGLVASVDAYSSAVAAKEAEIAQTKIEDTLQRSEKAFERFGKNVNDIGAFRDVANALSQVRVQEEELARAQKEANAPGLITRGLRAVGLSSAPTAQELGGRAASAQRGGAEIAQRTIDLGFAAGLDLSQIQAKLNQTGQNLDELVVDILKADTAYQEQVAKIQAKNLSSDNENAQINALTNEKKKEIQQSLVSRNAQVLQARANAKLTKAITVASASITRTFDNLDQSIAAASNSLKNVQGAINKIVTGATGFNRSLESINVLQNPRAFSRAEQNAAIKQGSQFAGADRAFVEQMSRFSLDVNDIIGSIAATGQKSGEDPAQTAKKTVDAVTKAVENQFGRSALTDQIRKDLSRAIKDAAEKGEDVDIQKLLENKIPEFNIGKRALESAAKSAQILQQAFDIASGAVNEYAKIQNQLRDNQANYQNTLLQSDLALKEALGQRVTVGERIGARNRVAATRAGVGPNQLTGRDLGARRDTLQRTVNRLENELERARNSFDKNVPGATAKLIDLEKRFASAENALRSTEAAISDLPKTIEANINDIIGEIGRVQQERSAQQQAGAGFAERLVGSTPQELAELSGTFNILNNTLNGQITTINQSQAAQQAYFQALRNGSSQQEAYAAAQQAFAGQTKSALSLFNEFAQFSGLEGPEINNIRADLLEGFAKAQGFGVQNNPIFKTIIENLRKPPEQSPEIIALTKALDEQQRKLAEAQTQVNQGLLSKQEQILRGVNETLITQLKQIEFKFDQAQVNQMSLGIARPGRTTGARPLQDGGVVYASQGQYVNYQPRGTDTVPAMLTPGEFVVNAKAAKNNLGLLRSINSSAGTGKTFSRGGVVYAAGGLESMLDDIAAQTDALFNANRSASAGATGAKAGQTGSLISKKYFQGLSNLLNSIGKRFPSLKGLNIPNLLKLDVAQVARNPAARQLLGKAFSVLGGVYAVGRRAYAAYNEGGISGALTGNIRGGGDAGAERSFIGTQLGVERGGYTDLAAGNLTEFGAALSEGATAGAIFGPPGALVGASVAGGAQIVGSTIREVGGLATDSSDSARQRERVVRMQKGARATNVTDETENKIIEKVGPRPELENFTRTERGWIVRRAKLKQELEMAQSKQPRDRNRVDSLLDQIQRHESGREQAFSQRVKEGYLWDTEDVRERSDAEIDRAVNEETAYQRRAVSVRRQEQAAAQKKELQETARREGILSEKDAKQLQKDYAEEARIRREEQQKAEARRQKIADIGLAPNATDQEINAREEQINQDIANYKTYQTNQTAANQALKNPLFPPTDPIYNDEYKTAIQRTKDISSTIDDRRSSTFDPSSYPSFIRDNPSALAKAERKWRMDQEESIRKLYEQQDAYNQTIIKTEGDAKKLQEKEGELSAEQRWENYRKGQDQIVKDKEKQQRRQNARLAQQKANAIYSAAKYANISVPDKFANPGAFLTWRKNIQKRLQADFPFAGQMQEALKQLGVPGDVLTGIYEPFKPDELEAVYSGMLAQGGLGAEATAYVAALRQSKANAAKKIQNDPRLQQIIASASPQVKSQIARKFGSTFGKQARQVGIFNRVVGGFQNLDPRRQGFARANLLTRLSKQGLIDINASDEDNIRRLTALQGGAVASFMYPGVGGQTQNRALRPKRLSGGGVVYASNGMLVPYEPRGTDTVPAMLTPGEFVVNRAATQKHRPLLESINKSKGGSVKYLQEGGSTDINKYIQGVPIESPLAQQDSRKQDEILSNIKTNTDISKQANSRTQNIDRNTNQVPQRFKDNNDILKDNSQNIENINTNADQAFGNVFGQLNFIASVLASERFQPQNANQAGQFGDIQLALDAFSAQILGFASGGKVPLYAQKGTMVNYQPQGTDTVPAMLTPGEFVVNAKASKENLGLLQAINSGYMNDGGVVYAQNGGIRQQREAAAARAAMVERNREVLKQRQAMGEKLKQNQEMLDSWNGYVKQSVRGNKQLLAFEFYKQLDNGTIARSNEILKANVATLAGNLTNDPNDFMGISESIREAGKKYSGAVSLLKMMRKMQENLKGFVFDKNASGGDIADKMIILSLENDRQAQESYIQNLIDDLKGNWSSDVPQLQQRFGGIQALSRGGIVYAQKGRRMPLRFPFDQQKEQPHPLTGKTSRGIPFGEFLMTKSRPVDEKEGDTLKAFGVGAAKSATPTAAGIAAGAYTTAATAPVLGPFAAIPGLIAGVGVGRVTALAQEGYLDFFAPEANQEAKRLAAEQPLATALGSAVPGVGAGLVQQGFRSFAGSMSQRLGAGTFSTAIGGAAELVTTGRIDPTNAAINFGTGFGQPGVSPRTRTGSVAPEQTFTVYHGSGSRINNQNLDISRGRGLLGEALYTGINAPDTPGDVASSYATGALKQYNSPFAQMARAGTTRKQGFEGGIYPISVKGSIDDFAEYRTPLGENPKARDALVAMYEKLGFDKTRKERIVGEGEVGSALLGPIEPDTFREVPIDFDNLSFEDIKNDLVAKIMQASANRVKRFSEEASPESLRGLLAAEPSPESLFRQLAVEAGIPGVKDTVPNEHGALMIQGPMLGIYDRSRVADVGQPSMPSEAAMQRAPLPPPLPPKKKNPLYQNQGGIVYANNGMLVPYRPKGTDTVPAMLTPGEFVVNRAATQQHLPALQAMNRGGKVSYLENGTPGTNALDMSLNNLVKSINPLISTLTNFGRALQQSQQNIPTGTQATNNNNGVNTNGIQQFTTALNSVLTQLQNINIPSQINITAQHAVDVRILGGDVFAQLEPGIRDMIVNETSSQLRQFGLNNFDNIA